MGSAVRDQCGGQRVYRKKKRAYILPYVRTISLWVTICLVVCVLVAQVWPVSAAPAAGLGSAPDTSDSFISSLSSASSILSSAKYDSGSGLVKNRCLGDVPAANLIEAENTCPGTDSWRENYPLGPSNAIMGFTTPASVNVGQSIQLYVSTTAFSYVFEVYRVGWYQGYGARLMYSSSAIAGIYQPPPLIDPVTGMVSCADWHDPVALRIPPSWLSGVYIVKLISSAGYMRYTLFVVRDDSSAAPVLVQLAVMTYQAYNNWGGRSLYDYNSDGGVASHAVSFDRPYRSDDGLGLFPNAEFNLIEWLERNGYDASYMTDVDLTLHPRPVTQHRLIIVAGHDEYWTTGMRDQITAARDAGISLAFFSANDVFWHARLQSSSFGPDRVLVCYRTANLDPLARAQPSEATVEWREKPLSQPENSLLGELYAGIPNAPAPLVLAADAQPFLTGTHLSVGSAFPGLVFGEVDTYVSDSDTPAGVRILAASPVRCDGDGCSNGGVLSMATLYTAPSGASVFNAGSFYWAWGLDDDHAVPKQEGYGQANADFQQFVKNILSYLLDA